MTTKVVPERVIRQRVIDSVLPLAPLTILSGIPGTAKSTLVAQMCAQARSDAADAKTHLLIDFPRRALTTKSAISVAVEAVAAQRGVGRGSESGVLAIRRGRLDMDGLGDRVRRWAGASPSCSVFVTNYEWQASPELDELMLIAVTAGVDVVCTLVDPEPLVTAAQALGISVRLLDDAELCFTRQELALLAALYGVKPTPELLSRVEELTAGHPMISSVAMMQLAGIEKAVVNQGEVTFVGPSFPGGSARLRDLENREGGGVPLFVADPSRLIAGDLGNAVSVLQAHGPVVQEFRRSMQGRSPFVRFASGLLTMPWGDLEALESVWPGCSPFVQRLNNAGYIRMEFDGRGHTRLVWNEGVRAAASTWNRSAAPEDTGDDTGAFDLRRRLITWYVHDNRLDEAVRFVADTGSVHLIEALASMSFVDLVTDGHSHGFGPFLPATEQDARSRPTTTVLAALESHPLARDDQDVAAHVMAAVEELEARSSSEDAEVSLRACLHALVGLSVVDRWEEGHELGDRALNALARRPSEGTTNGENAKVYLVIGILSLTRCELQNARLALSRAVALARRDGPIFVASAVGLHALEGYFGEFLFDRTVDRARLMELYRVPSEEGLAWQESRVFLELARTWNHLWRAEYGKAHDAIRSLVVDAPRSAVQPMVVWTYGLVLLLNGMPTQAHAFYRDVEEKVRRSGLPQRRSSVFVLGYVLACLADSRLGEAVEVASRRPRVEDVFDRLTETAIASSTGDEAVWASVGASEASAHSPTARSRTLLSMVRALTYVRSGQESSAHELMQRLLATADPHDVEFVCRFMSREINEAFAQMVAGCPPGAVKDTLIEAVEGPHIFRGAIVRVRLTKAQLDVLRCLAEGKRNKEIAESLFLSVNTVKTHLREINRKLGTSDRHEAVALARRIGVLQS